MSVLFENEYVVSREAARKYFTVPSRPEAEKERGVARYGGAMRAIGLMAAGVIIVFSFIAEEAAFFFLGILLAVVYVFRIVSARSQRQQNRTRRQPPPQPVAQELKWKRVIRFDKEIEVIDPNDREVFEYSQIVRFSEDRVYATLWMYDGSTVRVSQKGFTTGTYEDFKAYMQHVVARNANNQTHGDEEE